MCLLAVVALLFQHDFPPRNIFWIFDIFDFCQLFYSSLHPLHLHGGGSPQDKTENESTGLSKGNPATDTEDKNIGDALQMETNKRQAIAATDGNTEQIGHPQETASSKFGRCDQARSQPSKTHYSRISD